jgi:N-acetylglucosamine-6-phosphate deacetylase
VKLRGHVITPDGIVPGEISFGRMIGAIEPGHPVPDRFILPGFIDGHVHGGGGGDTMGGVAGIATLTRFHLRHGTTTLLPTTITHPWPETLAALQAVAEAARVGVRAGAAIAGAHLEGPFINPARLGAQPPCAILPAPHLLDQALAPCIVRVVTLAVEMAGGMAAAARFAQAGVRVSLGHSAADYDTATAAIGAVAAAGGTAGGTHLFNAMGGMEGRKPGLLGALLGSGVAFGELILDLHHVHPGAFRAAYAALGDRLMLITDAMRGTGLGDCDSELGGQTVMIRGGEARLANGSLAGSVLTMDAALRNALGQGLSLVQAARLTSTNAARYLGLADRGALIPGLRADFVVLDGEMRVAEVWLEGERLL